jgi:hypothetical protein
VNGRPGRAAVPILLALVAGCGLFLSPYDAITYQHLTGLKAFHLHFVDQFTERSGRTYDAAYVRQRCDDGALRFREAQTYEGERSAPDRNRLAALAILEEEFLEDCALLLSLTRLFDSPFAAELKEQIAENYRLAIRGELARSGVR